LLSTASRDEALAGTQVKIAATIAAINLMGGPSVDWAPQINAMCDRVESLGAAQLESRPGIGVA